MTLRDLPRPEDDERGSRFVRVGLLCLGHHLPLAIGGDDTLRCTSGCRYQIVRGIPRFVDQDPYAESFGLQWNKFRTTQLDSISGLPISRQRLERLVGAPLETLSGKRVLEAGCGAGRFTEVLLESGASVVACDLSSAVDANRENCQRFKNHVVLQADIRRLPLPIDSFDVVICIGVLQHTPSPEESIACLVRHVAPGGILLIDHYARDYPDTMSRRLLRWALLKISPAARFGFVEKLVQIMWPLHRAVYRTTGGVGQNVSLAAKAVRYLFTRLSPLVDHQYLHPQIAEQKVFEWILLDTHDTLTDVFKHKRDPEELAQVVEELGFHNVRAWRGGNGSELRAVRTSTGRN